MKKEYSNGEITVVWQPDLCIHVGNCAKGLPEVFNPKARPWVAIDAASTSKIKAQVEQCPSGALSYYINSEQNQIQKPVPSNDANNKTREMSKIQVIPNGPIKVSGPCEVSLPNGTTESKEKDVFLCRCGESSNKPYCDGSHKAGFSVD